jgi:para-aminobenzoate synthetase/4-amino-4-deoxychorismate lyase
VLDPQILTRPGTVLLDTARTDTENRRSYCFAGPRRVLTADSPAEVPTLVKAIEEVTDSGGYVAGYLSYEAGFPFVDLDAPSSREAPAAWFGVYDRPQVVAPAEVDAGLASLEGRAVVKAGNLGVDQSTYTAAVERIRRHIQAGDVYQINYTAPFRFSAPGDPRLLYRRLRRRQHVPYGAYLNVGNRQILSCSPELFFRRDGRRVVTRPMKGTIQRGRTLEEDRVLRDELAADPKNRAENLMIVDLLRNDLSVCCRPGSVKVPELYATESYDTVTQMTSTVEGRLRSGQGLSDVLRALFPCGSVTGAPKRRAMRLIRELESTPRGVYCGAIGMAGPATAVFNVAIRTAVIDGEDGTMGVGSGVVWDSDPQSEYEECALKTQFLTPSATSRQSAPDEAPPRLIETMRFDGVRFPLLDRHVERLARSADYFDYPFDTSRFRRRVEAIATDGNAHSVLKVRAALDRWGRLAIETRSVEEKESPWRLTIAEERVDATDPLFYHKTTHRRVYEQALQAAQADGFDEALLLNEEGEVTEGTYSNLFVREGDTLFTPPVSCGLLAGVYRDYVLGTQDQARERVLTPDDLQRADAVYCCNAVRGWCEAVLEPSPKPSPA